MRGFFLATSSTFMVLCLLPPLDYLGAIGATLNAFALGLWLAIGDGK